MKKAATAAAAENITLAEVTWCGIRAGAYGEKGMRRQMEDETVAWGNRGGLRLSLVVVGGWLLLLILFMFFNCWGVVAAVTGGCCSSNFLNLSFVLCLSSALRVYCQKLRSLTCLLCIIVASLPFLFCRDDSW